MKPQLPDCDICNNKRHIRKGKYYPPCECLEHTQRMLKVLNYSKDCQVQKKNTLLDNIKNNMVIAGSVDNHKRYIAGVYYNSPLDFKIKTVSAYDLIQYSQFDSSDSLMDLYLPDLLILLVGFGASNKLVPPLIEHVYVGRQSRGLATWFIIPRKGYNLQENFGAFIHQTIYDLPIHDLNPKPATSSIYSSPLL